MAETNARDVYPRRLVLAVIAALAAYDVTTLLPFGEDATPGRACMAAAITAFVAACWLAGAIPLGAASIIPIALMPLLGALPVDRAAGAYAHPIVWLFFGGFILALGIERWGLHRRIALGVIQRFGVEPSRLVFGFMAASALLSMWMTNTATTLLLLPIAQALVKSLKEAGGVTEEGEANFAFTLLIGIAYAASLGGIGTPIGTAPNALYLTNWAPFESRGGPPMTFPVWMVVGSAVILIMVPSVWLMLTRVLAPVPRGIPEARQILDAEAQALPKIDAAEKRMLALFAFAAFLWIARRDVDLGPLTIPGWWNLFPVGDAQFIGDGAVAVVIGVLAFIIPSGRTRGRALMDWETARKMPWDILFLIGGGIAIARAFKETGLSTAVGSALEPLVGQLHPILLVAVVSFVMTFLTEVTSNTATTALLLPILVSASLAARLDPRLLMLPATISASCAFMLPIATPPNAIVFASGHIPMRRMARTGLFFNLLGVVVITLLVWFVARPLLGIDLNGLPAWALSE